MKQKHYTTKEIAEWINWALNIICIPSKNLASVTTKGVYNIS